MIDFLKGKDFFESEYTLEIDRAHRLGRKREDANLKPRPIIVRFSFFQDKEKVLKNGRLLRNCDVNVSEDFSKITLNLHKELRIHAKEAQNKLENDTTQDICIAHFKVTYRRILVTYHSKNNTSHIFNKSIKIMSSFSQCNIRTLINKVLLHSGRSQN